MNPLVVEEFYSENCKPLSVPAATGPINLTVRWYPENSISCTMDKRPYIWLETHRQIVNVSMYINHMCVCMCVYVYILHIHKELCTVIHTHTHWYMNIYQRENWNGRGRRNGSLAMHSAWNGFVVWAYHTAFTKMFPQT